jgi:adenylate kinase
LAVRLVLLGAPGSGKGTQGALLAEHFGVPHVSSGELLRAHVAAGTDVGRQVADHIARGELVPDELVLAIVGDAVLAAIEKDGYILDGFPRTLAQAERAYALAAPVGLAAHAVVYLVVPDDVARERVAGRTEGRTDDADPVAFERRIGAFHAETEPLLEYYRERGILVAVDAARPTAAVTGAVLEALTGIDTTDG